MDYELSKYPYFICPAIEKLRSDSALSDEERDRLRRYVAANVGDIPSLRQILGIDPDDFANFYPDMAKPVLSTSSAIDSFLANFGNPNTPVPTAAAEIQDINPAEEILPSEPADEIPDIEPEIDAPEPVPTIEMANSCIKSHDYKQALQIIQALVLNNPEKSIYFADQIRFLKKLILLQNKNIN